MALHYHGLPLTPERLLGQVKGCNFCVSFATDYKNPRQKEFALRYGQSVMWDNGAFSLYRNGGKIPWTAFYRWIEPRLGHPHWAVIPDVIDGSVKQQRELRKQWPFSASLGAPVWHLALPLEYLLELADEYPRICFGSSGIYWNTRSTEWEARMDEAFETIYSKRQVVPWVHGLRMLSKLGKRWPLASADSTNVGMNVKRNGECPGCMAKRIDQINGPHRWLGR